MEIIVKPDEGIDSKTDLILTQLFLMRSSMNINRRFSVFGCCASIEDQVIPKNAFHHLTNITNPNDHASILRSFGVPRIPELRASFAGATLLSFGTNADCYVINIYKNSRVVTAVAKVFHPGYSIDLLLREVSKHVAIEDIEGVPELYGVSLSPPAIVMSYHWSSTLRALMTVPGPPPKLMLKVMEQVTEILGHIHSRSLVHNDINADNIVLDFETGVKTFLTGFSVMTHINKSPYEGRSDIKHSEVPYCAPEVITGVSASPSSDVYSLAYLMQRILSQFSSSHECSVLEAVSCFCLRMKPKDRVSLDFLRQEIIMCKDNL